MAHCVHFCMLCQAALTTDRGGQRWEWLLHIPVGIAPTIMGRVIARSVPGRGRAGGAGARALTCAWFRKRRTRLVWS